MPAKPSPKGYTLTGNRRKIRLIVSNAKCRHLNEIDLKRDFAAGVYLSEAQNPIPPLHTVCVYTVYLFTQGGGRVKPRRRERRVHKAGPNIIT